jgi:hypothetical protein
MYSHTSLFSALNITILALCQISKEAAGRNAFISLSPAIKVCFRARTANFSLSSFLICANIPHPQQKGLQRQQKAKGQDRARYFYERGGGEFATDYFVSRLYYKQQHLLVADSILKYFGLYLR